MCKTLKKINTTKQAYHEGDMLVFIDQPFTKSMVFCNQNPQKLLVRK